MARTNLNVAKGRIFFTAHGVDCADIGGLNGIVTDCNKTFVSPGASHLWAPANCLEDFA
jgi:hypothetical protein